jgi:hypothetical protein
VLSNVSEEHTASVFRVQKKCDANSISLTFKVISDKCRRVLSNVSEVHTASVFRVEKKCDANSI